MKQKLNYSTTFSGSFFIAFCFMMALSISLPAQVYPLPSSVEYAYPTSISNGRTNHSSAYKWEQFVLAAWDETSLGGMVIWQVMTGPNSTTPLCQGVINYPSNFRDIEVGMLNYSGGAKVAMVAYHKGGSGHYVDLYKWDPSTCSFSFMSNTQLSFQSQYSRISMDSHKQYAVAIVWEEFSNNTIKSKMFYSNGVTINSGFTHSISGSSYGVPDVAFTHKSSSLDVQFVYYDMSTYDIVESKFPYWTLYGWAAPNVFVPLLQDLNNVPPLPWNKTILCNIDGPDHGSDNWAYTYTDNDKEIRVRLAEYSSGTLGTFTLTDGSMGNVAINTYYNRIPVLAYYQGNNDIMVGWYSDQTSLATPQSYLAVGIRKDGSAISTSLDYLQIPNNPVVASPAPTIAFSKTTEANIHNYTFYPELISGLYDFKHKFHPWISTGSYKTIPTPVCEDDHHADLMSSGIMDNISVYPNPFTDNLNLFDPDLTNEDVLHLIVTDINGKELFSITGKLHEVNTEMNTKIGTLSKGIYALHIHLENSDLEKTLKIHKE